MEKYSINYPQFFLSLYWGSELLTGTHKSLYNTVCYNMVLDITRFKDRPQKCIDFIEKWPINVIFLFMVIFLYNLYLFI